MYISGSRIRDVAALTANVGGQPIDTEDSAVVALRFDNGILGTLTSGYYLNRGYHSLLKIWGSGGWVALQKHTTSRRSNGTAAAASIATKLGS
jgi:predicted dehydrogenase